MRVTVVLELDVPDGSGCQDIEAIVYDAMAGTDEPSNPDIVEVRA